MTLKKKILTLKIQTITHKLRQIKYFFSNTSYQMIDPWSMMLFACLWGQQGNNIVLVD